MRGGFFLRKNPLSIAVSERGRSENAERGCSSNKPCIDQFHFVISDAHLPGCAFGKFVGASLLSAFLTGPGETIRDKSDVAARCGEPPAKRHSKIKGEPRIPCEKCLGFRQPSRQTGVEILRATRSGLRLRAQTPARRLSLPVTILRGITRSHPEHGS